MAHGGKRPNAGRRKGSENARTKRAKAVAAQALEAVGKTPLEVMLETMRERWDEGDHIGASAIAKDAAPYVHPKLAMVDNKHSGTLQIVRKVYQ